VFFDIHKYFAGLLSHLTKLYGYSYGVDLGTSASLTPQDSRSQIHSRSGSVGSSNEEERYAPQGTVHRSTSSRSTRSLAHTSAELARATSGLSVHDGVAPQAPGYTNSSRRNEEIARGVSHRQVAVGY